MKPWSYYYLSFEYSKVAITEVDKVSRIHDRSADQYGSGAAFTNKAAYQGNLHWMDGTTRLWQGKILPIPTSQMAASTRKLAKKSALGNKANSKNYNLGRDIAVELEYNWRIYSEWENTITGLVLFGSSNLMNYLTDTSVDRRVHHKKFMHQATHYAQIFNVDPWLLLQFFYFNHVVQRHFKSFFKSDWKPFYVPRGVNISL